MLRASADGRFVAHLALTDNPDGCRDLERLRATDDRGCAAFSVYEIASGRRVLGPVVPPFGPGDIAINADGSRVAVAGGFDGDLAVYRTRRATAACFAGLPRPRERDRGAGHRGGRRSGPDGQLYAGSLAGPIRELDPATLAVRRTFDGPPMSSSRNHVVVADGLLVAGGTDALVAFDLRTGARRWTVDLRGATPDPCPTLAVAPASDRLFCADQFGVIYERYLESGERTGVDRSPQLGRIGDLSVDGRELVAFGGEAGAVSRWRLDGSGPVTDLVAAGHLAADGVQRRRTVLARRPPPAEGDARRRPLRVRALGSGRQTAPSRASRRAEASAGSGQICWSGAPP